MDLRDGELERTFFHLREAGMAWALALRVCSRWFRVNPKTVAAVIKEAARGQG